MLYEKAYVLVCLDGVCGCLVGVWMVSGWCLRLSENVSIPNILATNYIRP